MDTPRTILHLDLDAFFCAVEELLDPSLAGKAFAVGGKPNERGVVASCSYPARRFGVHSAMPMGQALRQCGNLIIVSPHYDKYSSYSHQVMDILHSATPLVEQVSIDEAFLDVSALPESGEVVARGLQAQIREQLNLPCSLGVASNKLVAKIATDAGKHRAGKDKPPCAITVVQPGEEEAFLRPLPANALWGVGPKTAGRLAELGIHTIGDIAIWPVETLVELFGQNGRDLAQRARGIDDSPVATSRETKSISQETTFSRDVRDETLLRQTLHEQATSVADQLHKHSLTAKTVKIKIRWPDFTTLTRQVSMDQPTDQEQVILKAALGLFGKVWQSGKAVRLIGVGVSGLGPPIRQMSLWEQPSEKERKIKAVVEDLHQRFGDKSIRSGKDITGTGKK
jgi:DNA polymerase-4